MTSSATGLVVPVDVVAYCVGSLDAHERTGTFAGATTSYTSQASDNATQAFLGANVTRDPFTYPPLWALEKGVHVHWAAPDGLTRAATGGGTLDFPPLPNRWLVTRVLVSGSTATGKSWIVESDTLSQTPPGGNNAPTLPVDDAAQSFRYVGVSEVFDGSWQEPSIPPNQTIKALFGSEIHAVASGDIAFAAFYPNARGVFGLYDDTADIEVTGTDPVNLTYVVTGWYSDPSNDPLTGGSDPATLQQRYRWTYTPDGADPTYSLYSGVVQDVGWNPNRRYLGDAEPEITVDVAIGNTPAEALAAYVRGVDHPTLPLFEQLFTAFEIGLLSTLQQPAPGQLAQLAETVHEKGFTSVDGGTMHTIVSSTSATGDDDTDPAPNLPIPLADALNLLNEYQQQFDLATVEVQQYKWQLFADWYRLMQADSDQVKAAAASNTLSDRLALWPAIQQNLTDAQTALTKQLKVVDSMLGPGWARKVVPAPRFWQPNEPVVLMAGAGVATTGRHGGDGRYEDDGNLVCRPTTSLVTGATVEVTTSAQLAATGFPDALPASPNHLVHASDVAALVGEACVLGTALAAALAGGSDAALETALAECLIAGAIPEGSPYRSFSGSLPSPVAMSWWGPSNPWVPLSMMWELDFAPLFQTASKGSAQSYSPSFFTGNFTLDPDAPGSIGYTPEGGAGSIDVDPAKLDYDPGDGRAARYTGTSVLSTTSVDNLTALLEQYLLTTPDTTLQAVLDQLQQTNVVLQPMSGLAAALLTRAQALQLNVGVGSGAGFALKTFTREVTAIIPDLTQIPPLSPLFQGSFNPVRAGFAELGLQVLDAFGEKRPVQIENLYLAEGFVTQYRGAVEPEIAYLQPRLAQPARVLFRWLAADTLEYDEMNAHPATSPICGWLLPSHLEQGIFFYDQLGQPLGSLTVKEDLSGIDWQATPGRSATIDETVTEVMQDANVHLAAVAEMLAGSSVELFQAFYEAVDSAASSVSPPNGDTGSGTAVLLGRPVALVQASLLLELQGVAAYDQTWNTLVPGQEFAETDDGVTGVGFPAVVGDIDQLDDGLVGYFKDSSDTGYDLSTFFSPAAGANAKSGVVQPAVTNLLLTPAATVEGEPPSVTTGEQKLLMLMDPRAGIHLTTGILPTQYIEIPSAHYAGTLSDLEATFLVAPVLRPTNELTLPLSDEAGYTWSWIEERVDADATHRWAVVPDIGPALAGAVWQYTPQQLTEGWLRLSPEVLTFTLESPAGGSSVKPGVPNTLTLTIANRRPSEVTFTPGRVAVEGTPPTGSVWYVHFGALVEPSQVASISPSAPGWVFEALRDDQYGSYWGATPAPGADVTLQPGQTVTVTFANVVAASGGSQAWVYFDYYAVQGVNDGVDVAIVAIDAGVASSSR